MSMVHFAGLWGLTDETLQALLAPRFHCAPGDHSGLRRSLPDPVRVATVNVPACELWPWLAQTFRGGGTYGWPALETATRRSADYVIDAISQPRAGDSFGRWLELVEVEPCRRLCWRVKDECVVLDFPESGLMLDYRLSPVSARACRLESRISTPARHLTEPVACHLRGALDFLLPAFQLPRLRTCAETLPQRLAQDDTNRRHAQDHQVAGFVPGVPGLTEPEPGPPG
jgi:hypothetical protein